MAEYRIFWERLEGRSGHAAGRALLRREYEACTGRPMPEVQITERGKPYFSDGSLHFSISHTKNHVFLALSPENIAIDAEEADRRMNPRLAGKILSPGELARYRASAEPGRALLALWVLKEAAAKYTGLGLTGYPNHTDFSPEDPRVREIDGCLVAVLQEER